MHAVLKLSLLGLLAMDASGQHRSVITSGGGPQTPPSGAPRGFALPLVAPIPPLGMHTPFFAGETPFFDRGLGFPQRPFFRPRGLFPVGAPVFVGSYDYVYPPPSNVIIIQTAPPEPKELFQQLVSSPVKSDIREYKQSAFREPAPSESEPPTFSIALKDSSVHSAAAVWVQDDTLHFVTPEGVRRQVSLDLVDRETTRTLNRQKKLELRLPAPGGH